MIFELKNIPVKKLFRSRDFKSYLNLQSMIGAKDVFVQKKAKSLQSIEFGQVASIKRTLVNPSYQSMFEVFNVIFGINLKQYERARAIEYLYAVNHIKREMLNLVARENKMLSGEADPIWNMAGADRLNRFAELNTLVKLGKEYGKEPREIERWTYATVFSLVLHDKTLREVQERYYELKKNR